MKFKIVMIALIALAFVGCNNEKGEGEKLVKENPVEQVLFDKEQIQESVTVDTDES